MRNSSVETLFSEEYIPVTYSYKKLSNMDFVYRDAMMEEDARSFSTDLAKVSIALSDASYDLVAISNCLTGMEYTILKSANYSKSTIELDSDFVAYTIAKKPKNGINYYVVAVRGTPPTSEWISNFNVGDRSDGYHEGFWKASK